MNKKLIVSTLGTALVMGLYWNHHQGMMSAKKRITEIPLGQQADAEVQTADRAPASIPVQVAKAAPSAESWETFRDRFGSDLRAEFDADGRLSSVRGSVTVSKAASGKFNPKDPQKAIARAREVIDAAAELLGLQAELPLENPIAKSSDVSAQVFFSESKDGVLFAPSGQVTVDLGPQGELLGLYSNYIPNVNVHNDTKISVADARRLAVAALPQADSTKAEGGSAVLWISGNEGHRAYDYQVQGQRVIVDASSGAILAQRDTRKF